VIAKRRVVKPGGRARFGQGWGSRSWPTDLYLHRGWSRRERRRSTPSVCSNTPRIHLRRFFVLSLSLSKIDHSQFRMSNLHASGRRAGTRAGWCARLLSPGSNRSLDINLWVSVFGLLMLWPIGSRRISLCGSTNESVRKLLKRAWLGTARGL